MWEVYRGNKKLATLDVVKNKEVDGASTSILIRDAINIDTVIAQSVSIIQHMQQFADVSNPMFKVYCNRYGLHGITLQPEECDWTAEDWEYFLFDVALALVEAVKSYRLQCYKCKETAVTVLEQLKTMANYILELSGEADEHIKNIRFVEDSIAKVAQETRVQPVQDGFMPMPE